MTPELMQAGARTRQAMEAKKASNAGESGGRKHSYSRVVTPGEVDVAHGAILYLDDITVSFDGFKALISSRARWRKSCSISPVATSCAEIPHALRPAVASPLS